MVMRKIRAASFCAALLILPVTVVDAAEDITPAVAPAAASVMPVAELSVRPRFISGIQPDTAPAIIAAETQGRHGKLVLSAIVTPSGTLDAIELIEPSGSKDIDAAVIAALKTWKLSPALDKAGNKVATKAKFPFFVGRGPKRLTPFDPVMPEKAKALFHNGKVTVAGKIDREGKLIGVVVKGSSKSDLLDNAMLAALEGARFDKPKDLTGNPTTYDTAFSHQFSQAEGGTGSYLGGLKSYNCQAFVGETDWWVKVHPGTRQSEMEFYKFMGGVSFVAPEALGWGKVALTDLIKRHPKAWDYALTECRKKPDSRFLEQYRKG